MKEIIKPVEVVSQANNNERHRLIYLFSMLVIALNLCFLIWFFVILFFPFKPVHFKEFNVTSTSVTRGDYVDYQLEFEKTLPIKPKITWYIVDGTTVILNTDGINRPVGTNLTRSSKQIPATINPGVYRFQVDLTYEITPFRKIYYSWQSNEFLVE